MNRRKNLKECDYLEGRMIKSDLFQIRKSVDTLMSIISDNDEIDGWIQDKITIATDYLEEVCKHIEYNKSYPKQMEHEDDKYYHGHEENDEYIDDIPEENVYVKTDTGVVTTKSDSDNDYSSDFINELRNISVSQQGSDMNFKNGDQQYIDPDTARQIIYIFDSLTIENKNKMINIIDKDLISFMKILDFSQDK